MVQTYQIKPEIYNHMSHEEKEEYKLLINNYAGNKKELVIKKDIKINKTKK